MFQGSMVALVTPLQADGTLDRRALHDLVEWHIASGTDALIIGGTTGESCTLTTTEHTELLTLVIQQVNKRIPIIAGAGSCSTQHALLLTQIAQKAGADAVLIITPYCNKPSQQGLYEHYGYIAKNSQIPIILYNVPGRTACDLLPETIERLAEFSNIIGIKEATGDLTRTQEILARSGSRFAIYSGDDATAMDLILLGAKGVISVTANVAPQAMHDLCAAALKGDKATAEKINDRLASLHKNLFLEANPIPVKWALSTLGRIAHYIRLPLTPLNTKFHDELKAALRTAGVLE